MDYTNIDNDAESDHNEGTNRVFYSLLERVGSNGQYQFFSHIIWCALSLITGSISFFIPFLYSQGTYQCPPEYDGNCRDYVCGLPENQWMNNIQVNEPSLIMNYGQYYCDQEYFINNVQSLIFSGLFLGIILSTCLLRFIRKKIIITIGVIMLIIGSLIAMYSPTLMFSAFGSFLIEAFATIPYQMSLCYISETVSTKKCATFSAYIYTSYSIGMAINGLLFYLFSWKVVMWCFIIIPLFACLIAFYIYVEETPFDMITSLSAQEAYESLMRIAKHNQIAYHGLSFLEVENIKKKYQQNRKNKNQEKELTFLDLFYFPSLRYITIISIFLHFFLYYLFGAPELVLKQYSLSIYINGTIIGMAEVLGSGVCIFFIDKYERKKIVYVTCFLQCLILCMILRYANCYDECSVEESWFQTAGLFAFRLLVGITYNVFYVITYEMFPTQIRSQALLFASSAQGLSELMIPIMINLSENLNISIIWTFLIGCILIVVSALKLPETFNVQTPDIILELRHEEKKDVSKLND